MEDPIDILGGKPGKRFLRVADQKMLSETFDCVVL